MQDTRSLRAPAVLPTSAPSALAALFVTLLALLLSATLGTGAAHAEESGDEPVTVTNDALDAIRAIDPEVYEKRVQRAINARRAKKDLAPVKANSCADTLAERWGKHLATNMEFYHQSLDPFFDRCEARYAGETLARGTITPKQLVRLWMESPSHKAILMSRHPNRVGIGAHLDSHGTWVVAADFIKR